MPLPPFRSTITAFALGLLPLTAAAQSTEAEAPLFELDPYAVEAFAIPFSAEAYPGSAQVLEGGLLRDAGYQNLAEALEAGANLRLQSISGNPASAAIDLRGYGENGALRTLILVDGQPLNRVDMATPSWLEVPLGQIERVEILRGPQTARFGNFAVGGVVNIITRLDPSAGPTTEIAAGGGSYESAWGRLHHQRPLAGGVLTAHLDASTTDGYRENGGYEATAAGINYARSFDSGSTLRVGARFLDDHTEFPGPLSGSSGGGFPNDPRSTAYGSSASQFFGDRQTAGLTAALAIPLPGPETRLETRGGLAWRDLAWNFGPGSHADNTQLDGRLAVEYRQGNPEADRSWGIGLAGAQATLDFTNYRDLARTEKLSTADLEKTEAALYAFFDLPLSDTLSLSGAARGERHSVDGKNRDLFDPSLDFDASVDHDGSSAQVGLQWKPVAGWRSWIRYDRLYRFPVTDEIAAYQRFGLSEPFNRDLGPETGDNGEIGFEWTGALGTFGVNGFVQRLEGEIAYDYLQNLNVNLADTERWGTEIHLATEFVGWSASLRYTWLQAEFANGPNKGREVPLVSPHAVAFTLSTPRWHGHRLTGEMIYRSRAYEGGDFSNTARPLPAWTVVNLAWQAELTPSLTAFFRLNNVFDRDYATLKFYGSWYPEPGRHVRGGLQWKF